MVVVVVMVGVAWCSIFLVDQQTDDGRLLLIESANEITNLLLDLICPHQLKPVT